MTAEPPDLQAAVKAAQQAYYLERKDAQTYRILAVALGCIGVQHLYLGYAGRGLLSLAFAWTFVPLLVGLYDAYRAGPIVLRRNAQIAREIAARLNVSEEHLLALVG